MDASKDATIETLREVMSEVIEQARKVPEVPGQQHHQVITLHHAQPQPQAPWHSWACLSACAIMLVMSFGMGAMYLDMRRAQARTDDYVQTTYMLVPKLRELVEQELKRRNGGK